MTHNTETVSPDLLNQLEAVLFASEAPLSTSMLVSLMGETMNLSDVENAIGLLNKRYEQTALEIVSTVLGWRVQVKNRFAAVIARAWPERPLKLSQALLETLAVIAYYQPVTRGEIEHLRGVSVNHQILRTLFERNWIVERGHREIPGRPALLHTTSQFLDSFGLKSVQELPQPAHKPALDLREE